MRVEMSNRILIFGDGGKAKELARIIASNRDTQVIIPIEQHDEEIRADERRKFVKWLVNKGYFLQNTEITDDGELFVLDYEKEMKTI